MWKSLNPGEKVHAGNTIRYRSSSLYLKSYVNKIYDVVKADQHYFEVEARMSDEDNNERDRKVIKYMDVGYHIRLEIWSGTGPFVARHEEETD
ncbi:MAG: hypothetical protein J0H74_16050 [Chitinophagaceae bacterium]|nr:hypothetical protein [Chitinophagaceae bacterium]